MGQPDPVLKVWEKAFPGTVKPYSSISPTLMAHLRYPEDLFKVQRDILSRYHVTTAERVLQRSGLLGGPARPHRRRQQPAAAAAVLLAGADAGPDRSDLLADDDVDPADSATRRLPSSPSAAIPGKDYGTIRVMEFKPESNTPGPQQVQNNFDANSEVSQQLGLLRTKGSTVSYGNLLTLPLTNVGGLDKTDGGLLYVEPVYVQRSTGSASYPLLQKVLVAYGENIGFQDTLDAALEEAFTGKVSPGTGNAQRGRTGQPQHLGQPGPDSSPRRCDTGPGRLAGGPHQGRLQGVRRGAEPSEGRHRTCGRRPAGRRRRRLRRRPPVRPSDLQAPLSSG